MGTLCSQAALRDRQETRSGPGGSTTWVLQLSCGWLADFSSWPEEEEGTSEIEVETALALLNWQ